MDKDDKKIIEFIEKFIKPAVIEVSDHLGPFWYTVNQKNIIQEH